MFNIGKVVNYYQSRISYYSITIPGFFVVMTLVYIIFTVTTNITAAGATAIATSPTTSIPIEQLQKRPDGESDENEPITDLPVIDTPCKSPCPPSAEMCIYMCK